MALPLEEIEVTRADFVDAHHMRGVDYQPSPLACQGAIIPVREETARRARIPVWKILAWIGVGLFVLLSILIVLRNQRAERKWAEMTKRTRELLEEAKSRDSRRPVLRGEATAGNAWDDYALALAEMGRIKVKKDAFANFLRGMRNAEPELVRERLAKHGAALENLRAGAGRERGQFPYEWERGWNFGTPNYMDVQTLAYFAAARARIWREERRRREAAELLLDTCQFARDHGHNGPHMASAQSMAVYGIALDDLRDLAGLSKEDFLEIARGLEILDRAFPKRAHTLLNERLAGGMTFEGDSNINDLIGNGSLPGSFLAWRQGFSPRLMAAEAMESVDRWMTEGARAEEKGFAEEERVAAAANAAMGGTSNPLLAMSSNGHLISWKAGRLPLAQLRLLRVAATWKAGEPVPELEDPFGGKLFHSVTDGKLKVWSVRLDGLDGGGKGEWEWRGADIVLEVER